MIEKYQIQKKIRKKKRKNNRRKMNLINLNNYLICLKKKQKYKKIKLKEYQNIYQKKNQIKCEKPQKNQFSHKQIKSYKMKMN